ncbi:MAG TPA: DUF4422 domain-containing protein [Rhizobium sp.]|nr:DUF4422 domain-containing protein [Rhizobium sp.]
MLETFVACHVDNVRPDLDYCVPIQTGAISKSHWDHYLHDDSGDNISAKNRYFGEHTGLYWVWKNTTGEHVGWCHYRRYFSPMLFPDALYQVDTPLEAAQTILNLDRQGVLFNYEMGFCDIILPRRVGLAANMAAHYCHYHRRQDWEAMIQALHEFYPGEAVQAQTYFNTSNALHPFCMFMASRSTFNAFCEWLFPFLFFLEGRVVPDEDDYQCRVFSYLAERLFNWWVISRRLRVVYRPVLVVA